MFSEINECLFENDCDDVATCIDNAFDYECKCTKEGFTGEGKGCVGNVFLRRCHCMQVAVVG